MAFVSNDLYSSSAGTELFNYWNPFVTKFDSQSFYNFEQDNQPLYDLEERTFELWEKSMGYSPSSLNGMPLVVSGILCTTNRNVFTNLQEAIDALPNIIRTPTLIEVAASGYLGGLHLKNIKIIEDGVLEIVNRGFAKVYSGAGNEDALSDIEASSLGKNSLNASLKGAGLINALESADLSSTIFESSALSVETNVSSLFFQPFNRTLVQNINLGTGRYRNGKVSMGYIDEKSTRVLATKFPTDTADTFLLPLWEASAMNSTVYNISDPTVITEDVSALRGDGIDLVGPGGTHTGAFLSRNSTFGATYAGREVAGMTYANTLSAIDIQNCNGPLYIRGFCVEGVSGADVQYLETDKSLGFDAWKTSNGIEVINSNASLENCSVIRSISTGAKFVNSDVKLSRGFFAYRNYEIISPGSARSTIKTAGIHAINSRVNLEINPTYASGADYSFNTQHHTYGAILENSQLVGGQSRPNLAAYDTTLGFSYNKVGLKAINSTINVSGNLDVYNNDTGISLVNSHLSTDRMTVENNALVGLEAAGSNVEYNNSQIRRTYGNDVSGYRMTQTLFLRNGVHLDLKNNSTFTYALDPSTINIPVKYGALRFNDSHGIANHVANLTASASLPAIRVANSTADLLHTRIVCSAIPVGKNAGGPGVIGAAIKATNSAQVNLLGTINGATIVQGSNDTPAGVVGISAENGSTVSFRGPTLLAQFNMDALAENNSTLEFVPHRKDGIVDVSGFNLENKSENHTSVELHSTGDSCLGALNNSQIIMEDLGSPVASFYGDNAYYPPSATWVQTDYDTYNISAFVEGGSMQFYPNPPIPENGSDYLGDRGPLSQNGFLNDATLADDIFTKGSPAVGAAVYNYYLTDFFANNSTPLPTIGPDDIINKSLSNGGFCVRIFSNSSAKVNSVNFPCGWTNPNGTYFDASATAKGCNQLRIWSLGDSSKLNVANTSVSGQQPYFTSGYHGPRAVFFSGTTAEYGDNADPVTDAPFTNYGAFSGTAETSCLSVLDWYGLGVNPIKAESIDSNYVSAMNRALTGNASFFGRLQQENLGPFRLFFAVNPMMRYVGYPSGGGNFALGDTKPLQHLSQGYSLSGAAGIPYILQSPIASSLHMGLMTQQEGMNLKGEDYQGPDGRIRPLYASGFYYGSAMLAHDNGTHVYLDENSANIFANAKNCAMPPLSGRAAPKVSIYRSTVDPWGIGYAGIAADDLGYSLGAGVRGLDIMDPRRRM